MTKSLPALRRLAAGLSAVAAAALLLSCTSSGDGGLGGGGQIATGPTYTSDPTGAVPYLFLDPVPAGRTRACFDVRVQSVTDLYSLAFSLRYDPLVMRYSSASAGTLLGNAGEVLLQAEPSPPAPAEANLVVVGISRRNDIHGTTGVTGSGTVITLCFDLLATTPGSDLEFVPALEGEDAMGTTVLGASQFHGGVVVVR